MQRLVELIGSASARLFHLETGGIGWEDRTLKERNVILFLAGHPEYHGQAHPLNQVMRAYFARRASGGTIEEGDSAARRRLKTLAGMKELLRPLRGFLDEDGISLKTPGRAVETPVIAQGRVYAASMKGDLLRDGHEPEVYRELIFEVEVNVVEILHLGWPRLGGSCLDLIEGDMRPKIADYALNPAVRVLYVRDRKNPEKPVARVAVAFDAGKKILFPVSGIKSSTQMDFQPLVGHYLIRWADLLNASVFASEGLGFSSRLGHQFRKARQAVKFPSGLCPIYTELVSQVYRTETVLSLSGWFYKQERRAKCDP